MMLDRRQRGDPRPRPRGRGLDRRDGRRAAPPAARRAPGRPAAKAPGSTALPMLLLVEPLLRETSRAWDAAVVIALPRQAVFRPPTGCSCCSWPGWACSRSAAPSWPAMLIDRLFGRPAYGLLRVVRSLNAGDVRARMRRTDGHRRDRAALAQRERAGAPDGGAPARRRRTSRISCATSERPAWSRRCRRRLAPCAGHGRAGSGVGIPAGAVEPALADPSPTPRTSRARRGGGVLGVAGNGRSRTRRTPASCGCPPPTPTRWSGSPTRCGSGAAARC